MNQLGPFSRFEKWCLCEPGRHCLRSNCGSGLLIVKTAGYVRNPWILGTSFLFLLKVRQEVLGQHQDGVP